MNPLRILFGIFSFVGLISLIIWVPATFRAVDKAINWETYEATVIRVDPTGFPTVGFLYHGNPIQFLSYVRNAEMTPGASVWIHFPPGEPKKAEVRSFFDDWFMSIIVGVFVLVFGGVGLVGFSVILQKQKLKLELFDMGRGRRLTLPIYDITQDYSFRSNGTNPYIIVAQYHDKELNIRHEFKSNHIWFDPAEHLGLRRDVDVYVDPDDFRRYHMDISFLPKKSRQ